VALVLDIMVRVKICGITNDSDLQAAVDAGADALGFICGFPTSPRNLSISKAATLISRTPPMVSSVLVTNVETLRGILEVVVQHPPSAFQLYGDVGLSQVRNKLTTLGSHVIRPILVGSPNGESQLSPDRLDIFDAVLTDTYDKKKHGALGGTGKTSNWLHCREIREQISPLPLILSGGLNPENVAEAIGTVGPYAVDTSSGVERVPGKKDHSRVRDFVRIAKEAG
jgi:phosphoribosylanthranilate isomerase